MNKRNSSLKFVINPIKRVSILVLVAIIAFSVPSISNVISQINPLDHSQALVAHAQSTGQENLMDVNETVTTFHINHNDDREHWAHRLNNDGKVPVDGPDFDVSNLTYVIKLPNELSHLLDDQYVLDYLFGKVTNFGSAQSPFMITGFVMDETGERITINKDNHKPYEHISVNKDRKSVV